MTAKRVFVSVLAAISVLLLVALAPRVFETVRALPLADTPAAAGVEIAYPGRLTGEAGQAVADGAYDFAFALYRVQSGGSPYWSEVQEGVTVDGGAFATTLGHANPIPSGVLAAGAHWLAVSVRGPGESQYTALTPRQHLAAAAPDAPASTNARAACPHDHFGEQWLGASSDPGLYVENTGSQGTGLHAYSDQGAGLVGDSSAGAGIIARSSSGPALVVETGALQVKDAGLGTATPVFIHQVIATGDDANLCTKGFWDQYYSTVVDHPLTNGNQDAILFITPNYGLASSEHVGPAHAAYGVYYDDRNQCGFGEKWVIYAYDGTVLNDGQMFNVLVVVP